MDTNALRIAIAGEGSRADEVGEENRDELALLTRMHDAESCERGVWM